MDLSLFKMRSASKIIVPLTAAYLALPLFGLLLQTDLGQLSHLSSNQSVLHALNLSLSTALFSTLIVVGFGTPFAWWLSRRFRDKPPLALQLLIHWPLVIPPSVLGLALLDTYGNQGLFGLNLAFTPIAIVLVQTIVAAPLYLQAALSSFSHKQASYLDVAKTLGASDILIAKEVIWPLNRWALLGGASLAFARALGEFGATLIFAGNLPRSTQTVPLAIYEFLEADLNSARFLALVLLFIGLALITVAYRLQPREQP